MMTIQGNDVRRAGEKIGYLEGNDVYDQAGHKAGYYRSNDIYDHNNHKIGYVEGNYVKNADGRSVTSLSDLHAHVSGGAYSDLARAAVYLLLGD
jgi:hypothetical protein